MKITSFEKTNIDAVRSEIDAALKTLEKVGIKASIGTITYCNDEARAKLTCMPLPKTPVVKIFSGTDAEFFQKHIGETILINGKSLTTDSFKPRNRKYPFICGQYKLSRKQVQENLL